MAYEDNALGVGWVKSRPEGKNRYSDNGYYYTGRGWETLSEDERFFITNASRAKLIAEAGDPAACYSFDDNALYELDGVFYWFNTSGCSCPSPDEVWDLVQKGTRGELVAKLEPGNEYAQALNAFIRAVKAAGWTELKDAPVGKNGNDF